MASDTCSPEHHNSMPVGNCSFKNVYDAEYLSAPRARKTRAAAVAGFLPSTLSSHWLVLSPLADTAQPLPRRCWKLKRCAQKTQRVPSRLPRAKLPRVVGSPLSAAPLRMVDVPTDLNPLFSAAKKAHRVNIGRRTV